MSLQRVRKRSVCYNRNILDHRDTVDMLGNDLTSVTMQCHLGLMEWLENVITGLCVGHPLTAETVAHLVSLAVAATTINNSCNSNHNKIFTNSRNI